MKAKNTEIFCRWLQVGVAVVRKRKRREAEENDETYTPVEYTGEVLFYDNIKDKNGDQHWAEFRFVFLEGKLDAKYLEEFYILKTAREQEEEN